MAGRGPDEGGRRPPGSARVSSRVRTRRRSRVEDATGGARERRARKQRHRKVQTKRCVFRRSASLTLWGKGNDGGPTPNK